MSNSILVVEDEKRMIEIICDYIESEGYAVYKAADGLEAMDIFDNNDINLVILDIMIPKLDGWSVCRRIRKKSDTLIIILSARSDEDDKLLGFELGADEYVTKPFSPKVLMARVKALLKRFENNCPYNNRNITIIDELCIDKDAYKVLVNNKELNLTIKEYELLLKLVDNKGKVFKRDVLINSIWGYDYFGDGRVIDTNIKTLRKKLGICSKFIKTVIGVGYKFEVK
ncbi:response regulator transcription factor [Clostridium sp. 'deep sea']|uniref:response regulator transcription factor n=1 Tax=Clostridium sp. 'deep sea' TaxID=2779445 RepID=UPI0018968843|nr:response regulator transcription factor [Clostridium sp. 'deep sea']QOR35498.1 response regulator transcription factor [Clostridium sp. 'deep sea']